MNREIPGFYYDPEKKKYFKIQANHKATPGSQYTQDSVKRKRVDQEKHQRKIHLTKRATKEKIKRAAFLSNPLLGVQREIGSEVPWPDEYTIKHVLRNKRSGILIAIYHPIRLRTSSSLWCSSACPTGEMPLFAVGTSDGLYTLEGFGSYWALSKNVEWLSSDVIAAGLKDSAIFLHDLRSGGSATRLQHPHAVTKMRRVDPYRIVVAGINSVPSPLSGYQYANPISSVCFEPGDGSLHGPQTPSLLVCAQATVDEWIWSNTPKTK
ncbi:hypothetical protein ASPNIDRAFT_122243 [Aspergillus niger ATCC 1015]|uniref:Uncharacterized protein n=1 Tax=Aspergillus niger (strain ATCC 1015 / CBS 113.46 / FGSC A1144 / LSHB Ac4 / NCTC 3858a / NRRL 328 / USDA 3528.7) TaxID=380704 RepID=G3XSK7_ASPNA|nr:hypothetical protein ASPNIDRAFT_122243 [Aspergillus niger ATCC 1015]